MKRGADSQRTRMGIVALLATVAFVTVAAARSAGLLQPLDLAFYDHLVRLAARAPVRAPPIVLVLVRETDIRRFGYPLRDDLLQQLIEQILAGAPRALGVDLYRDQPVPRPPGGSTEPLSTPAYRALGSLVRDEPRIVMTMKLPDASGHATPPPPFARIPEQVGFADLPVDAGGTIRRGLLFAWQDEQARPSFALRLALRFLEPEGIGLGPDPDDPRRLRLGPSLLPPLEASDGPYALIDAAGYQFLLDYRWGSRRFERYDVGQVLDGRLDPQVFRDRIVLIGTAASSVKDSFYTPLRGLGAAADTLDGIEIHAHSIDQLLRYAHALSHPLRSPAPESRLAWIAIWSLLGAVFGLLGRSLSAKLMGLAAGILGLFGLAHASFLTAGFWLPAVAPAGAAVTSAGLVTAALMVLERADRRQLAGLFSRFQGPAVAEQIWRDREDFLGASGRPRSRRVTLTTLVSDLEGYTAATEKLEPEILMNWVNEYLEAMAQLVEEHGGVVDDYAGDGIKANFGFPMPSREDSRIDADARAAVDCALGMGRRVEDLNRRWRAEGLPTARCRVGVATGPAVAGCIGGERALKYTSVGDTVNTAARLEAFDKDEFLHESGRTSWRVLIAGETRRRTRGRYALESIGKQRLKGKRDAVAIYRVLGLAESSRQPPDPVSENPRRRRADGEPAPARRSQ